MERRFERLRRAETPSIRFNPGLDPSLRDSSAAVDAAAAAARPDDGRTHAIILGS